MNVIAAIGLPLLSIIGWTVVRKKKTLDALSVDLAGIKLDPLKDIKLMGTDIGAVLRIGNPRGSSLSIDIVDLRISLDGREVGRIQQYNFKGKIKPQALSDLTIKGRIGTVGAVLALGRFLKDAITAYQMGTGTKEAVMAALPKKVTVKGVVRAEGGVFNIDKEVPLVPEEKLLRDKDGKPIKEQA
jgi:hypothetical protein